MPAEQDPPYSPVTAPTALARLAGHHALSLSLSLVSDKYGPQTRPPPSASTVAYASAHVSQAHYMRCAPHRPPVRGSQGPRRGEGRARFDFSARRHSPTSARPHFSRPLPFPTAPQPICPSAWFQMSLAGRGPIGISYLCCPPPHPPLCASMIRRSISRASGIAGPGTRASSACALAAGGAGRERGKKKKGLPRRC